MYPCLLRTPKCPLLRPELNLFTGPITLSQVLSSYLHLLRTPKCPLLRPELYLFAGPITQSQVLSLLPYADSTTLIRTNGSYIWQAFEHSVADYDPTETEGPGPFLQVSGKYIILKVLDT